MPGEDLYHAIVLRCLEKEGWSIVIEHEYISIGTQNDTNRRLYIDIKASRADQQRVLVEVKGLQRSPVQELMELLGQYLVYQLALEYLAIEIPLYVAVPQAAHQSILQHVLGQEVLARYTIPLLIFDPLTENIVQWNPQL